MKTFILQSMEGRIIGQRQGRISRRKLVLNPMIQQTIINLHTIYKPGRVEQSVGHLTRKSGVLGSIPGLATYFRFSFRFFKKDSCQLLAKVCARSTG